jgi:hypothetical protein
MKKIILAFFLVSSFNTWAQTLPEGFETWRNYFAVNPFTLSNITTIPLNAPNGWESLDSLAVAFGKGNNPSGTFKSQVYKVAGHSGSWAPQVITLFIDTIGIGFGNKPTPNAITNGKPDVGGNALVVNGGFNFTSLAQSISFWVKCDNRGGDSVCFLADLVDNGDGNNVLVAQADTNLPVSINNWTKITLPFSYIDTSAVPTLLKIIIGSSAFNDFFGTLPGHDSTSITVDDIEINFFTGINMPLANKIQASVYPNPVNNTLHVQVNDSKIYTVQILDALGKIVSKQLLNNSTINTASMQAGNYLLLLSNEQGQVVYHTFIQKQ